MPAPPKPYQNPYRAVGGVTVAGGANTGVMGALQNPDQFNRANVLAGQRRNQGGVQALNLPANPYITNGGFEARMGGSGGSFSAAPQRIGGRGEAPLATTAADYERAHGGSISPGTGSMGSLQDFYAAKTTNPLTGLSYNPSANDLQRQQQYFQQKGDFEGLSALNSYNQARGSGDPMAVQAAASNIRNLQGVRARQQGYMDAKTASANAPNITPAFGDGVMGGANKATSPFAGLGSVGTSQGIPQTGPMTGAPGTFNTSPEAFQPVQQRAKGGSVGRVNPYVVGEKGPEEYVPMHGKPEMVGLQGPEMRTFPDKGKIVPTDKLPHRAMGGSVMPTNPYLAYGIVSDPEVQEEQNYNRMTPSFSENTVPSEAGYSNLMNRMAERGATPKLPITLPTNPFDIPQQTFVTKYGTVSNVPTTKSFEGQTAQNWFQNAANRWGANPYAVPEKDFPKEGIEGKVANKVAKNERLQKLIKPLPEGLRWAAGS